MEKENKIREVKMGRKNSVKFKIKDIVKPSGKGRTAKWRKTEGTVTSVRKKSVFVIWHGTCVEDQMELAELIKVGVNDRIPEMGKVFNIKAI